jgi:hypothetical protein
MVRSGGDNTLVLVVTSAGALALPRAQLAEALQRGRELAPELFPSERGTQDQPAHEPLLDSAALAARLDVPHTWVEEAARRGSIPSVRCGRYVRFDLRQVLEVLGHSDRKSRNNSQVIG